MKTVKNILETENLLHFLGIRETLVMMYEA